MGRDQGDLLADPRRARLPQPDRQALLHPVRIDDAGPAWSATGWSSPNIPMAGRGSAPASTSCRIWQGRLWGALPERGDVVIVTPPGQSSDYIKRVIGLPGDTIEVIDGDRLSERPRAAAPGAAADDDPGRRQHALRARRASAISGVPGPDGRVYCRLPVFRETPAQRPLLRHDRRRRFARATISRGSPSPRAASS